MVRVVGWSDDFLVGQIVGRLICRFVGLLVPWFVFYLVGRFGSFVDSLPGRSVGHFAFEFVWFVVRSTCLVGLVFFCRWVSWIVVQVGCELLVGWSVS